MIIGQWYHIAVTRNASNVFTIYKNGIAVGTGTQTATFSTGTNMAIGSIFGGAEFVNGIIDEVRISDMALSPSQFLNAVPEPSSLCLLAMGGLAFLRRRRRTIQ